jgi:hypothetical protein
VREVVVRPVFTFTTIEQVPALRALTEDAVMEQIRLELLRIE